MYVYITTNIKLKESKQNTKNCKWFYYKINQPFLC